SDNLYVTPSMTSVWPALCPPWNRTTMSACSDNQSTIFPFPSSPHWDPTTTTLAMRRLSSNKSTIADLGYLLADLPRSASTSALDHAPIPPRPLSGAPVVRDLASQQQRLARRCTPPPDKRSRLSRQADAPPTRSPPAGQPPDFAGLLHPL